MGRNYEHITEDITVIHGNDDSLGRFLDVTDKRYAKSGLDEQGEGYMIEWSDIFGFSTNLIGIPLEDIIDDEKLVDMLDNYAEENFKLK